MERCTYLGKSIYADKVKLDFCEEQLIRNSGRERKLFCYDCGKPVIYKRGEIRDAHFAHLDHSDECDYEEYSKYCAKRSPSWKIVKEIINYHFSNIYPHAIIERDERLFKGHYTDFYIKLESGLEIAIEIDDKTMTSKNLSNFYDKYNELQLNVDWIVLDSVKTFNYDYQSYYIKRARLNESINHSVIVVDKSDYTFCMYKLDTKKYIYSDSNICKFTENVFSYIFDFEKLRISEKGLYIDEFESEYQKWLGKRLYEFKQRDIELNKSKQSYWDEDHYIEIINRIMSGEKSLIDDVVIRLSQDENKLEIVIFEQLYNGFKDTDLNNYIDIFETIINKIKETQL
ncbi:MAG: Competence protein CoiA-like family [Haloplasmataceae bacterium]|nr:Competence protein CoiA-like family [Haloplasmataceae bacterium]